LIEGHKSQPLIPQNQSFLKKKKQKTQKERKKYKFFLLNFPCNETSRSTSSSHASKESPYEEEDEKSEVSWVRE